MCKKIRNLASFVRFAAIAQGLVNEKSKDLVPPGELSGIDIGAPADKATPACNSNDNVARKVRQNVRSNPVRRRKGGQTE